MRDVLNPYFPGDVDTKKIPSQAKAGWLVSDGYVNLYSPVWKIPLLTAYELPPKKEDTTKRPKKYPADPRVDSTSQAGKKNQYGAWNYTRGHMVTAGTSLILY